MKWWMTFLGLIPAAALLAPACSSGGDSRCKGDGEVFAEPAGCGEGDNVLAVAGCYVACAKAGDACGNGKTCKNVLVNPCSCDPETGEHCCDACSGESLLCLP